MSNRVMPLAAITTAVVGIGAAGMMTAQAVPNAAPNALPNSGVTEVVAGTLSPAGFQTSLLRAYDEKKAADLNAMREAVVANWAAQAEAAEAAAAAAAAEAEVAAQAQSAQVAAAAVATPQASAPVASPQAAATPASAAAVDTSGASGDASAWANSAKSMSVKNCESGN
ncbi:MAG: hypothetical protein QG597_2140, partial [Actinomycetota bacterium]|nr:hypothetical protein [Actinomycetota bacterium]